jgi:enterochelin esterase family protein
VQEGRQDAVNQFWQEVAGTGPLVEPVQDDGQDLLVTFLWRATFETHNVLVGWPMAAWREDDYYMSHLQNTDVWYKTIQVRRGSRFSYGLSPNLRAGADRVFNDQLDPLNPRVFPEAPNSMIDLSSVFETPGAPDESWFKSLPAKRGTMDPKKFKSDLLKNERDIWIYTPPGYAATAGPYPLLLLFDGPAYFREDFNNALPTLDNLIAGGRIRPVIVCFIDSPNRRVDQGYDGADAYGDAIVRELMPQLRSTYAISTAARDITIGGFSASGLAASLIALRHSDVFGNVLSQSGWFLARKSGDQEPNTVAQMYLTAPKVPVRFYLETGLYEMVPSGDRPIHELALDEGLTTANRHFRDVLIAKGYDVTYRETATAHENVHWRATLADALIALLKPNK